MKVGWAQKLRGRAALGVAAQTALRAALTTAAAAFLGGLVGPGGLVGLVGLAGSLAGLAPAASARPLEIPIATPADDGEEIDGATWNASTTPIRCGRLMPWSRHVAGLRFQVPELAGFDSVLYARLRFHSRGGLISEEMALMIRGVLEPHSPPLSAMRRPSQLPKTQAAACQTIRETWIVGPTPLHYHTGDLSPILNEILAQPEWGNEGAALILCAEDSSAAGWDPNYLCFASTEGSPWPATLQVCRTLEETFLTHECLARPGASSMTVTFTSLIALEAYVEFGVGGLGSSTAPVVAPAGEPCHLRIDGLQPATAYQYRLRYRRAGGGEPHATGAIRSFRTQAAPGTAFTFTMQADSHVSESWIQGPLEQDRLELYQVTLENVALDQPDFHISLGDFSLSDTARDLIETWAQYEVQHRYLDGLLHSVPFYLVLGNHEGEERWLHEQGDSIAVWSETVRRQLFPNPEPDAFYQGCEDPACSGSGYRESYYAWEWGDALLVALDPYWYTFEAPFHHPDPAEGGGWCWSLGQEQYDWLHGVLTTSARTWKIVMIHNLTGGIVATGNDAYGRGGVETVDHAVCGRPSFEWGGHDETGADVFAERRPGWTHGPVHDLLREAGVQLVIHGHDHFCALQEYEGVVYALCPQPADAAYGYGAMAPGQYVHGHLLPNAGHLRFYVAPEQLEIEYVRAYRPGDGPNGEVALRHVLYPGVTGVDPIGGPGDPGGAGGPGAPSGPRLRVVPSLWTGLGLVELHLTHAPPRTPCAVRVLDCLGRSCARLKLEPSGICRWNGCDARGVPLPSGRYYCRIEGARPGHDGFPRDPGVPLLIAR